VKQERKTWRGKEKRIW